MSDLYNRIVSERGSLQKLASKIPGFRGYMEMSARREADRMIREHVATQLNGQFERFGNIEREMISSGGLDYVDKTKSIRTRLDTLRKRIETAPTGHTDLFASIKTGPDELAELYAFDEALLGYVDQIKEKLDGLESAVASSEGVGEAITALGATISEASQAFDLRGETIKGLAQG